MKRQKVKITATDKIGRTESITLMLVPKTAQRLFNAQNCKDSYGRPTNELRWELSQIEDDFALYGLPILSRWQYNRLQNFGTLIYHKFYNYTLTIE